MKCLKLLIAILLVSPLAVSLAQDTKTFNWTPPTEYTNGAPLANEDIEKYGIYCNGTLLAEVVNTAGTDVYVSGWLEPGTYSCQATAWANGIESERSNDVNFTVDPSQPEAPSGFSVTLP